MTCNVSELLQREGPPVVPPVAFMPPVAALASPTVCNPPTLAFSASDAILPPHAQATPKLMNRVRSSRACVAHTSRSNVRDCIVTFLGLNPDSRRTTSYEFLQERPG